MKKKKIVSVILSLGLFMTTISFLNKIQPIRAAEIFNTIVDDNEVGNGLFQFEFKQNWNQDTGYPDLFNAGTNHYSTKEDYGDTPASAILRFKGNGVEVYGNKQDDNSIYDIYLDGEKVASFDGYAEERETKQLIYKVDSLEEKDHQVEIVATNKKNKDSEKEDYGISIDYAKVTHGEILATDVTVDQQVLLDEGSTKQLSAIVTPYYASTQDIVWSSANEDIAKVDSKGVLSGIKSGKTEISATVKGTDITKAIPVTVRSSDYVLGASFGSTNLHYLQDNYKDITTMSQDKDSNFSWRGDRINAEIVTWTKNKEVNNLKINASDFKGEDGAVIDKATASINFLKETEAYTGRGGGIGKGQAAEQSPKIQVPDIIYSGDPVSLKSERVQSAWINIDVPEDAKPGKYTGTFTISADELEKDIVLNYEFTVYDLVQPKADDYQAGIELWEYPYAVAKYYGIADEDLFNEKHINLLKQDLKEYHDMGGNVITTAVTDYPWDRNNPYDYPSTVKWTKELDGTFTYDFSQFDTWVQLNHDMGINDKLKCFSMAPYHAMRYYDKAKGDYVEETTDGSRVVVGSDRWKEMWGQFLSAFVEHLDQKGWFDNTYIASDEVGEGNIKEIYNLVQQYKNKDGKTLKISAAVNYGDMTQETLDKINDISINIEHIEHGTSKQREINADRHSKGLTTTFYNCTGDYPNSFALSDPGESAWTIWYSATHQMDGYLRWSFDNWIQDPYKSLLWHSWEAGDTMLVYPDSDKNAENPTLHSTPRWEKMKEGKRNIEKLYYIKKAYPQLANDVDTLEQSLGRKTGVRNEYNGMYAKNQDDKDFIEAEVNRMNEGLKEISIKATTKTPEFDTSKLQEAIDKASALDEALYTKDSYQIVKDALVSAKEVLANPQAQDEIDGAVTSLENAMSLLVYKKADYSKLEAELKRVPKDLSVYTEESRKVLEDAINQIDYSKNITQQVEVDAYTKSVKEAIDNLVLIPPVLNTDKLQDAIDKANKIDENLYTKDSYQVVKDALENAKKIIADPKTQDEINGATTSLENAISLLVYKDADYSELKAELKKIPTDLNMYTEESRKALEDVVASIDFTKNITQQAEVDAYTKSVKEAINNLTLLPGLEFRELISDDGNIVVVGAIHTDVILNYSLYKDANDIVNKITDKEFKKTYNVVDVYNIKLSENDEEYTPRGTLDVRIKTTKKLDTKNTTIVYIDDKGNVKEMDAKVIGQWITFKTNHFSNYAIVTKIDKGNGAGDSDNPNNNVNTGDKSNMNALILMGICSLLVLGGVSMRKKLKQND